MTITESENKGKEVVPEEATLSTQVEPDNEAEEESEDKPISKKKGLFNHRFGTKGTKKEVATEEVTAPSEAENKKSKGFGSFLSRVKQTGSNKESEPVLSEDENVEHEDVHENVKTAETPTTGDHAKRQSLLNKLFGNTKKEPMAESTDQVVTTTSDQQTEEVTPSSPPLSRRVTGFFSKKKSEKKQGKATAEKDEELVAKDNQETPTVVVTKDDQTADESALPAVTAATTTTTTTTTSTSNNAEGITA